ncbi:MAG: hypothetical protein WAO95_00105 [Burkholderiales bacterium]
MKALTRRVLAVLLFSSAALAGAQGSGSGSGAAAVPLADAGAWQQLHYRNRPPHKLRFSASGLRLDVEGSAMPLIHPLPAKLRVAGVRVRGRIDGAFTVPPGKQGEEKFDDYVFRLGLVEPGERRLNFLQRQVAAEWVRRLYALAPEGTGIAGIRFLNVGADPAHLGRERQHPLSDLVTERVVALPAPDGRIDFSYRFERPIEAIAVWLSSDGDDTGARYGIDIESIELAFR